MLIGRAVIINSKRIGPKISGPIQFLEKALLVIALIGASGISARRRVNRTVSQRIK